MNPRTLDCIKELRANVVKALKDANINGIGNAVFPSRIKRAWPEESAFISVYTPRTDFDDKRTSPRFYFAVGELYVDIYARVSSENPRDPSNIFDVNDFLDDTSKAVVTALQPIESRKGPYGGLVKRLVLKSFSNNLSSLGERERGSQRIVFQVEYAVNITVGGPVDNFVKAENTLKMGSGEKDKMEFDTVVQVVPPAPPTPEPEEPAEGEPELEEPENDES